MAVDMFLKIAKIAGESSDKKHAGSIDVLSWSWGASQSGTSHSGGGAGSGKVSVNDMSITKYVDKSSTVFWQYCCKGTHIPECVLTVRKAGGNPLEYIKITMKECIISSLSSGGSGGEDRLTEHVNINFAKFKIEYTPQKADGSGEPVLSATWNIAANTESIG